MFSLRQTLKLLFLLVEPKVNDTWFDLWGPEDFYFSVSRSLYDCNQFFPHIIDGIRADGTKTPILIEGMSYSSVEWMPYLRTVSDVSKSRDVIYALW
jgi:hypothetical protein